MEERKIDLIDLMVEILYRWKSLLLAALAGALLLGGFSYHKSMNEVRNTDFAGMAPAEMREYLESHMFAFDRANVKQIVSTERSVKQYEEYLSSSVLMNLDPAAVPRTVLIYSVDCKDREEAEAVTALYVQILRSGELAKELASYDDSVSEGAMGELIRVLGVNDSYEVKISQDIYGNLNGISYSYTSAPSTAFTVTLTGKTPEDVSKMADKTGEYINGIAKNKAFKGRNHTCVMVSRTEETAADVELMECQKALRDAIYSTANNNVASAKDALKGSGLAYYNVLKEMEDTEPAETVSDENMTGPAVIPVKPAINKRYVVVGFAAGIFIYAGILLMGYLMSPRIHYTDDISGLYGISRIGSIPDEKKWSRSAYTGWLRKIRDRGNRFFAGDKAVELSCTGVRALCEKKDISSLCVIGCNMEGRTGEVASSIVNAVSDGSFKSEVIANILYDADAYKRFCTYQGVVLLEKCGETMYEEILEELKKISAQGITLLGAVIVE